MKKYLAVYIGAPAAMATWNNLPESVRTERQITGVKAWHQWAASHEDVIVDDGGPLGKTQCMSKTGLVDLRSNMMGYTVVRADSYDDAVKLFECHPHFTHFPGDSIEIVECLPLTDG